MKRSEGTSNPPSTADEYNIFISFRFAEAEGEAIALKAALEDRGYRTFVSNETPGADLQEAIATALGQSSVQVLLATRTYGKKTNQQYSTYQEMNYSLNHNPFLIKMPWDVVWEEAAADMALGGRKWYAWTPGDPVPDGLVAKIIAKAEGRNHQPLQDEQRDTSMRSESSPHGTASWQDGCG